MMNTSPGDIMTRIFSTKKHMKIDYFSKLLSSVKFQFIFPSHVVLGVVKFVQKLRAKVVVDLETFQAFVNLH